MNPNGPNGTIFGKNDPTRLSPKNLFLAIGDGMSSVFWKDSPGAVNGNSELLLYSEKKVMFWIKEKVLDIILKLDWAKYYGFRLC